MKTFITATLVGTILCLGIWSSPATANEDGGLRSVFARGAGERALALGGAYGAMGDDAVALYWNPAGLANLQRHAFAGSHTNLIGMGFQEQFGLLAVPSWRLGTFAISLRRFGVDGIEGRNDRGTLLDSDLQNIESELGFGYARQLGEAWRVGTALKLQRQELAGQSGGGLGLDLGVQLLPAVALGKNVPWAQRLALGLTFRNIVEPTIRLVNDDVRDPSAVRFGGAYATSAERPLQGRLVVDVEKTKDMDARLHLGAEVELYQVLALRVGSNDGTLAAGLGATWQNLTFNYAFEDNVLEPVHRFGLGLAFGASVDERRQAEFERREAEVSARLQAAFADEEAQRQAAAVSHTEEALAAADFATALERVQGLRVIAPNNQNLPRLEAAAQLGLAETALASGRTAEAELAYRNCLRVDPANEKARLALRRLTEEGNREHQRNEAIQSLYGEAMSAFTNGELTKARDMFAQALKMSPDDPDLRKLADYVAQAIRLQDEVEAAQAEAAATARRAAAREAESAAQAAARAEPEDGGVTLNQPQEVPDFVDDDEVVPTRPARSGALTEARRSELTALYEQGVAAAEAGNRDSAVRFWEIVASAAPGFLQVEDHLKSEYLARGMEAFATGRLARAIEIWEQAQALDPDDQRTRGYLERAHEHLVRLNAARSQ